LRIFEDLFAFGRESDGPAAAGRTAQGDVTALSSLERLAERYNGGMGYFVSAQTVGWVIAVVVCVMLVVFNRRSPLD
jgi:hypothetical protein